MRNLPYSSQRLNDCCKEIRGKHISDAFTAMEKNDKKGADYVSQLLEKLMEDGKEKGLNPDLFFVAEAFVGKGIRSKKIDIKAKGMMGIIRRPKSSLTIIMHEKPLEHMIKESMIGKTPPGIGSIFRKRLYESNADFQDLRRYSFMLSSRGRYYRRTQFNRSVTLAQREYQRKGLRIPRKQIEKYMLEKQMQIIVKERKDIQALNERNAVLDRKKYFEENYEKKK